MFETVAPETFSPRSRRVFYETLPLSIAFHIAAGATLLFANHWEIKFPTHSPKLTQLYTIVAAPTPPPPPPPPAAAPKPAEAQPTPVAIQPKLDEIVAPTVIPDTIPIVENTPPVPAETVAEGITAGVEGGVAGGVAGGSLDGVAGGEVGGVQNGVLGAVATEFPEAVLIERDRPLPMMAMSQLYPQYPDEARTKGWEDSLIVRYVIGKNGRVREVKIISSPERKMFADASLKAIRHWRFRPHVDEKGQPKEVVHEMTVNFRLTH